MIVSALLVGLTAGCSSPGIMHAIGACYQKGENAEHIYLQAFGSGGNAWPRPLADHVPQHGNYRRLVFDIYLNGKEPLRGVPVLVQDEHNILASASLKDDRFIDMDGTFHCTIAPGTHLLGTDRAIGYFVPDSLKEERK